jgi:hypothetical protein
MTQRKTVRSGDLKKKPSQMLAVRVREMDDTESLAMGFRQSLIEGEHGGVTSGAGCGSPWTIIKWKGKTFAIHAVELLADVVRTWDAEEADRIDGAEIEPGIGVTASAG